MTAMFARLQEVFAKSRSFVAYVLIGFTGLTIDVCVLILIVRVLHVNQYSANFISMSAGIINNFLLNAFFNFKKTDKLLRRFATFYTVGLVGMAVGDAFLWVFNGAFREFFGIILLSISPIIAKYQLELVKGVSIIFIAIMQYFLNKCFSFREITPNNSLLVSN